MFEACEESPLSGAPIKALIFDLMGTCLDWHSTVSPILKEAVSSSNETGSSSPNALAWRHMFFKEIHSRFEAGMPQEDIDETHRRTLLALLDSKGWTMEPDKVEACVRAWHSQKAWPDVTAALPMLKSKFDVIVLANGTARLQIDITKSSRLDFDLLLSSELLGLTKPDPAIYHKAIELLGHKPEECLMVAAHAYDLEAAKKVGMRTVYVQRWTEDLQAWEERHAEDFHEVVRIENDAFIDGRTATSESGGFIELAEMLGLSLKQADHRNAPLDGRPQSS